VDVNEAAFVAAIWLDESHTTWLVFADWLEERADPLADYIRARVATEQRPGTPGQIAHQRVALQKLALRWYTPAVWLAREWDFRTLVRQLLAQHPTQLDLNTHQLGDGGIAALSLCPLMTTVEELGLSYTTARPASGATLANSAVWANLRQLDLSENYLEDAGIIALAAGTQWTRLDSLNLANNRFGSEGVRALLANPLLRRLQHLDVRGNRLTSADVAALRYHFGARLQDRD
jgi:uncharacterized protein (TIGR02996 family)